MKHIIDQLEDHILSGCTGRPERLIGAEIETIFYNNNGNRIPVDRGNEYSSADLLEAVENDCRDEGSFITCSLEPGGQVEWASKPSINLHDIFQELTTVKKAIDRECSEHELSIIDLSVDPIHSPTSIKLIDQRKYHLMDKRFQISGNHGSWMMRNTTSVQVNIDMIDKQDAEECAFIADCIDPIASMIFSNAPFMNGKQIGYENLRYRIWSDTDHPRCGHLLDHGIHGIAGSLTQYCNHVMIVPVIFTTPNEKGEAGDFDGTIYDWLKTQEINGSVSPVHLKTALHQIFTHVRYKKLLEIRSADRPPLGYEMAPIAFWTALMERGKTREALLEQLTQWPMEDRHKLIIQAAALDLNQSGPLDRSILKWVEWLTEMIYSSLNQRSKRLKIPSELPFVEPFMNNVLSNGIFTLQTQEEFAKADITVKDFVIKNV